MNHETKENEMMNNDPKFQVEPLKLYRDATEYDALRYDRGDGERAVPIGRTSEQVSGGMHVVAQVLNRLDRVAVGLDEGIYTAEEAAQAVREMADTLTTIPSLWDAQSTASREAYESTQKHKAYKAG